MKVTVEMCNSLQRRTCEILQGVKESLHYSVVFPTETDVTKSNIKLYSHSKKLATSKIKYTSFACSKYQDSCLHPVGTTWKT